MSSPSHPIAGDDTQHIQDAINLVAAMQPNVNGFRGAVLLNAGDYDIASQLTIGASGIVLRGVGRNDGDTVLHARGTSQRPLIEVIGTGSQTFTGNPKRNMIDKTVPVGATSFRVDSTSGLALGDTVRVERPSTDAWIHAVGMDNPPDGDPPWEAGTMNIRYDRTITRIEGNRVFLDAPLANSFEQQYGGGTIQHYTWAGRIDNVGIENLRAESDFASDTDENHSWQFVSIDNAQNVWVRHTTSQYFADSAVLSNPTAKWVAVDDAINLDPKSTVTGERRYTFDLSGQLDMVANSQANSGRHDFVNNSTRPPGPHVFYNSVANNALNDTGPHQRWATGSLFDNITVHGNNIDVRNRGSLGTTHGWSGANMVIWNSTADGFIVQNPPTAQNWLIGSTGPVINDTEFGPQPPGYVDSPNAPVTVGGSNSLYQAQMNDSADVREFHWSGGTGTWSDALAWDKKVAPGVYRISSRDYLIGDIDNYTYDGAARVTSTTHTSIQRGEPQFRILPPCRSRAWTTYPPTIMWRFTIQHQLDSGERVVHGYLALGMKQAASSEVATDFLQLFDMDADHRLNFSALGWDSKINSAGTFVGVVDMGAYLDKLQSGSVNVRLNDDTGLDCAMYVATVATPTSDPTGPAVYLDRGGTAIVNSTLAPVNSLFVGGSGAGNLRFQSNGSVEVRSDYVQAANGTLTLELSASAANGILQIDDEAQLAGTLDIQLAAGFNPALNDVFHLMTGAGSITGQFDMVQLPTLSPGLSWQLMYAASSVTLQVITGFTAGDYNQDGIVDAGDYTVWRDTLGSSGSGLAADGDGNGVIDLSDYDVWKSNFGHTSNTGAGANANTAVPEPATSALLMFSATGWCLWRGRFASTIRQRETPAQR